VTIVGYGLNNLPDTKAYGIMRWFDFQYAPAWGLGWKNCFQRHEYAMVPQIMLDAKGYTFPNPESPPATKPECDYWPPAHPFPDANGYVLAVEVKSPPRVAARLLREGKLYGKPIVEPAGYRFVIEGNSKKNPLLKVERVQSLPAVEFPFQELASCF
jgi:hypothetical protein